jgi:uncharacterized protein (DUF362 family)
MKHRITRREFLTYSAAASSVLLMGRAEGKAMNNIQKSKVSLVHTTDRKNGVIQSIQALGVNPAKNRHVLIKPNFNTADPAPGSTHNDTLSALVTQLWDMGAKTISLGERSFPPTLEVMEKKGVLPLLKDLEVKVIPFDDLPEKDWVEFKPVNSHWKNGFRVARPILDAECLVSTGCIKTHQFGGVFTLSLKLHVGVVPTRRHGFDYMQELHTSPHQRKMIAEINAPFSPDLIVMDGIEVFVDGGPAEGKRARADVFMASTDRVAVDAAGLAVLKHLGSNDAIMGTPIFAQEQIARAVELGLGAGSAEQMELVAATLASASYRDTLAGILAGG